MSWYGVIAAACCCDPAGPCFGCGVTAWTATGFGGGLLEWVSECEEAVIEGVGTFYYGVSGTVSYTVPSSITMDFVEQAGLCCTWFGASAWSESGQFESCADCGVDPGDQDSPVEYRFRTEATFTICETSAGSGVYEATLTVVVRGERRTALVPTWTSFAFFPAPGGFADEVIAWCKWSATINPASWCPDGGLLDYDDGLAPTLASATELYGGNCEQPFAPGRPVNTSTLDWGIDGPPGDVTIS